MNINWPATIAVNAMIMGFTALILYLSKRQSAKAAEFVEGTLILRPSSGSRRGVLVMAISMVVVFAGGATLAWAIEEVETHVKVMATLIALLILIAMLLWYWRVATLVVFVSEHGVSVEVYGKQQMLSYADIREVRQSANDCTLLLLTGKKLQIPAGIQGYDQGIAMIRARIGDMARAANDAMSNRQRISEKRQH